MHYVAETLSVIGLIITAKWWPEWQSFRNLTWSYPVTGSLGSAQMVTILDYPSLGKHFISLVNRYIIPFVIIYQ